MSSTPEESDLGAFLEAGRLQRVPRACETCRNPRWKKFTLDWWAWARERGGTVPSSGAFEFLRDSLGYNLSIAAFYQHMRNCVKHREGIRSESPHKVSRG